MQFSNDYLEQIIPGALCVSGNCPPNFQVSFEIETIKKDILFFVGLKKQQAFSDVVTTLIHTQAVGIVLPNNLFSEYKKIISKITVPPDFLVVTVTDVEQALRNIAHVIRKKTRTTIIAVAGVSGARHTVIMLSEIIKTQNIVALPIFDDSQNNIVLEILKLLINSKDTDNIIIFEAKSVKRYELEKIVKIVCPTYAVITSVGQHSVESLGSLQDVSSEYRSIFSAFSERNIGIINGDQSSLSLISYSHPVIKFGFKVSNQIQARKVRIKDSATYFVLKIYRNKYHIKIPSTHTEYLLATLAAIAVAKLLNIPEKDIVTIIQKHFVISDCFEQKSIEILQGGTMITDLYTADPENMKLSLMAFHALKTKQPKIIILGNMPGLGIHSAFWHRQIGRFLRKIDNVNCVFVMGDKGNYIQLTAPKMLPVSLLSSPEELASELKKFTGKNPLILVKGVFSVEVHNFIRTLSEPSVSL